MPEDQDVEMPMAAPLSPDAKNAADLQNDNMKEPAPESQEDLSAASTSAGSLDGDSPSSGVKRTSSEEVESLEDQPEVRRRLVKKTKVSIESPPQAPTPEAEVEEPLQVVRRRITKKTTLSEEEKAMTFSRGPMEASAGSSIEDSPQSDVVAEEESVQTRPAPTLPPLKRDASWALSDEGTIPAIFDEGTGVLPYAHQVEGVRKVLEALQLGEQNRFLHYYAPRTGKTFIQAALAYFMARIKELKISLVVVVNDRDFLDTQAFEVIQRFLDAMRKAPGAHKLSSATRIVQADSVTDLAKEVTYCKERLSKRGGDKETTILFTTLQKFSSKEILNCACLSSEALAQRTVVMPDEVHRSHKDEGQYTVALERALGEDLVKGGLIYVALTGTPSLQALERFGTRGPEGLLRPFHSYHLGQAISDGLVMDPRNEYNEVASLLEGLDVDSISDADREKLKRIYAASPGDYQLQERVKLVLGHFGPKSATLKYQAQAMVLCNSREEVVKATELAREMVEADPQLKIEPDAIMGAFSGSIGVNRRTEKHLNGMELKSSEDAKKARLLFVAHKFETGYDNSALTFIYLFRRVCDSRALATQVMLRHCGKRGGKIRPVTLDFGSMGGEILSSIQLYFGDIASYEGVLHALPPPKSTAAQNLEEGGLSRKAVEELMVSRLQLQGLEIHHVEGPGKAGPELTVFKHTRRQRQQGNNRVISSAGDPRTDLLLLKLIRANPLDHNEVAAFGRILTKLGVNNAKGKANKKTCRVLAGLGAVSALKQVLLHGDKPQFLDTFRAFMQLARVDEAAKELCDMVTHLGEVLDSSTPLYNQIKLVAATLKEKPELAKVALKCRAGTACLACLEKRFLVELGPGVFDMKPLHDAAWDILDLLEAADAEKLPDDAQNLLKVRSDLQEIKTASMPLSKATLALVSKFPAFKSKVGIAAKRRLLRILEDKLKATEVIERVFQSSTAQDWRAAEKAFTSLKVTSDRANQLCTVRAKVRDLQKKAATIRSLESSRLAALDEDAFLQIDLDHQIGRQKRLMYGSVVHLVGTMSDLGPHACKAFDLRKVLEDVKAKCDLNVVQLEAAQGLEKLTRLEAQGADSSDESDVAVCSDDEPSCPHSSPAPALDGCFMPESLGNEGSGSGSSSTPLPGASPAKPQEEDDLRALFMSDDEMPAPSADEPLPGLDECVDNVLRVLQDDPFAPVPEPESDNDDGASVAVQGSAESSNPDQAIAETSS